MAPEVKYPNIPFVAHVGVAEVGERIKCGTEALAAPTLTIAEGEEPKATESLELV